MSRTAAKTYSPTSLLRKLLACFSIDWIITLLDLYPFIAQLLPGKQVGLYEILKYDITLELLDSKGETSVFKKHQRVKFLQNHVIAFEDYAWGDGDIFIKYNIRPGVEVDRYQEGDRWNILISLRETKNRGDIEDFYVDRTVKNGFIKSEEWQQVEIRHQTDHLKISVIYPKDRRCQQAVLVERGQNKTTQLGPEHFHELPDGRQMISWETSNIQRLEVYTLRWWW